MHQWDSPEKKMFGFPDLREKKKHPAERSSNKAYIFLKQKVASLSLLKNLFQNKIKLSIYIQEEYKPCDWER